jgi:hypothetical protein
MTYFKYEWQPGGICESVESGAYTSGMNLLNDYDKICDYNIIVKNKGLNPQKFVVFYKAALNLALTISIIIMSCVLMFGM